MPDPYESPKDETPGQRRVRLMNLTNEGWHPDKVDKVDEVPLPETSPIEDDPKPKPPAEVAAEPKRQQVKEK